MRTHKVFELTTICQNMFHSSLVLSATKAFNRKEVVGYSNERKKEKNSWHLCLANWLQRQAILPNYRANAR